MKRTVMTEDPIVAEVRRTRSELFAECGDDLRKLFAHLRRQRKAQSAKAHGRQGTARASAARRR